MFRFSRHRWLMATGLIIAPSLLLLVLILTHIIPLYSRGSLLILATPTIPNGDRAPLQLSNDPYTNNTSQHLTEVEPGTYSNGSTIVTAFQAGRYIDSGSSNIGWATSTDGGANWKRGFLPRTTQFGRGPSTRISCSSV